MDCAQALQLISAYVDGELDARRRAEAELHIRDCSSCAAALQSLSVLKASLAQPTLLHRAPDTLNGRIEEMLQRALTERPVQENLREYRRSWRWLAVAALLLIAVGAYFLLAPSSNKRLAQQATLIHQRALADNHLVDIASSDPAKVAGWLNAKLGFAPWIPQKPPADYVLVSGRVEVLQGLKVVALEYRKGDQIVSVFEWPSAPGASAIDLNYQFGGLAQGFWNAPGAWNFIVVASQVQFIDPMRDIFSIKACTATP